MSTPPPDTVTRILREIAAKRPTDPEQVAALMARLREADRELDAWREAFNREVP